MAQLTLYIPDELEKELKRAAKRAKKSVSSYVVELAEQKFRPRRWSKGFLATYGSWKGAFPEVPELPFEKRDPL
jgi:hypothetical protein